MNKEIDYGILKQGVEGREDLHKSTLLWVGAGVYYGYPKMDIYDFYHLISKGLPAPTGTPFAGTGYITTRIDGNAEEKDEVLKYIKDNRYCPQPFPKTLPSGMCLEEIKQLLEMDIEFKKAVYSVIEIL